MTTFFNTHGTSPSLDGKFLDLNFGLDEPETLRDSRAWVSVEELVHDDDSDDEAVDLDFEDRILDALDNQSDEPSFDWKDPDLLFTDRDIANWVHTQYSDIIEQLGNSTSRPAPDTLTVEVNWLPSYSSNHESPTRLSWEDDEAKWRRTWRSRNAQKKAKWRIDGYRARKDSNYRWSVRHAQMERSDAYYLEHQPYTVENFLDDNVELMLDKAYYYDWSQDPERVEPLFMSESSCYYDDFYWDYGMDLFLSDADYDDAYDDYFEHDYYEDSVTEDVVDRWADMDHLVEVEDEEFMPSFGSTIIRAKRRSSNFLSKHNLTTERFLVENASIN